MKIYEIALPERTTKVVRLTLYHGTSLDAAQSLTQNGWQPNKWSSGANQGQTRYLYLSTDLMDAEWFANEKGASTVVELSNVPVSYLIPDPEDSGLASVEEELKAAASIGLPAKLALVHPLPASNFRIIRN